jgi:DNA polymerase-3 subunit epsilon
MIPLFFDTETTGLTVPGKDPTHPSQPMPVQLGMKLDAADRKEVGAANYLIKTEGWIVNPQAAKITGIDNALADTYGVDLISGMEMFFDYVAACDVMVAHNARFDITVMRRATAVYCAKTNHALFDPFEGKKVICTMLSAMNIVKAKPKRNGQWKWPKLEECTKHFFGYKSEGAHDALVDVRDTAKVFYHLVDTGVFDEEPQRTRNIR